MHLASLDCSLKTYTLLAFMRWQRNMNITMLDIVNTKPSVILYSQMGLGMKKINKMVNKCFIIPMQTTSKLREKFSFNNTLIFTMKSVIILGFLQYQVALIKVLSQCPPLNIFTLKIQSKFKYVS